MAQAIINSEHAQAQRQAVRRIESALSLIATGLPYRDQLIRAAILTELAGTAAYSELIQKPIQSLDIIALTIRSLGLRLRDGFAYDSLLEIQTEARAIFLRLDRE